MDEVLTASRIVSAIAKLDKSKQYRYVNDSTKTKITLVDVELPEGPIRIKRAGNPATISTAMIWRIAGALVPNRPINFDRVLGASYNTRSALEALMAHTSEFYYCYPGRIEVTGSSTDIKAGHKHIIWLPKEPHVNGELVESQIDMTISELATSAVYESLGSTTDISNEINTAEKRRHALIQIAIIIIGRSFGCRTRIAKNDWNLEYSGNPLCDHEDVLTEWSNQNLAISNIPEITKAADYIDCIWFADYRFMPAVFEVEHSTGVNSGLARMEGFRIQVPSMVTRYIIVAPDEMRQNVLSKVRADQYKKLHARYLSYSSVEELLSLCQRRKLSGINYEFLDFFLEGSD